MWRRVGGVALHVPGARHPDQLDVGFGGLDGGEEAGRRARACARRRARRRSTRPARTAPTGRWTRAGSSRRRRTAAGVRGSRSAVDCSSRSRRLPPARVRPGERAAVSPAAVGGQCGPAACAFRARGTRPLGAIMRAHTSTAPGPVVAKPPHSRVRAIRDQHDPIGIPTRPRAPSPGAGRTCGWAPPGGRAIDRSARWHGRPSMRTIVASAARTMGRPRIADVPGQRGRGST